MKRGAEAVRSDNGGVVRERQLDQRDEAGEASLTGDDLLAHHPRVAGAEEEDEPAPDDPLGADLGGFPDLLQLGLPDPVQERAGLLEVGGSGVRHGVFLIST